jgi:ankyrin repeat protein
LHNAAIYGRNRILKLLVEHGANLNIRARYGKTPLDEAIKYKQTAVVQILRKHGAITGEQLDSGK